MASALHASCANGRGLNEDTCLAADLFNGSAFFSLAKYESNLAIGELGLFYWKILLIGYANLYENFLTLCGLVFGKQVNSRNY